MLFSGLFKKELVKEANLWVADGLISQEQAEQIGGRYGVDVNNPDSSSIAYRVLVTLGYLFIGLALIVLIGANWDEIPRFVRMAGLILLTLCTQLVGVHQVRQGKTQAGIATIFLGNLFFGASIILIAQIYHLGEHMPDGIFWWGLGCLPFAVLLCSRLLMTQSLALASLWFALELGFGVYHWLYLLFVVCAFYVFWRAPVSRLFALMCASAGGLWLVATIGDVLDSGAVVLVAIVLYFLVVAMVAQWWQHTNNSKVAASGFLTFVSAVTGLLLLLIFSFEGTWKGILPLTFEYPVATIIAIVFVCVCCMILSVLIRKSNPYFYVSLFLMAVLFFLVWQDQAALDALPAAIKNYLYPQEQLTSVLKTVCGIALFLSGVLLVQHGIGHLKSSQFYLGIVAILTSAWARYFDLVGGYIGGAILFIFCALVLLAAARYWKSRNVTVGAAACHK